MKKRIILLFVLAIVFALSYSAVLAQDSPFSLRIMRDWGYGNGADINGRMSLSIKGEQAQIQQVTFFMDGEVMATVSADPFKVQFDTNNYDPGVHRMTAEVKTTSGETYSTNALVSNFVEKGEANQDMLKILLLVGGIAVASIGIQFFMQKKKSITLTLRSLSNTQTLMLNRSMPLQTLSTQLMVAHILLGSELASHGLSMITPAGTVC